MNNTNWGVHVLGPDNVLAAHSFREAVEKCHEINMALINFAECAQIADDDLCPRVFAQVAPWEQIASGPHEPDKTDWADAAQRLLDLVLDMEPQADRIAHHQQFIDELLAHFQWVDCQFVDLLDQRGRALEALRANDSALKHNRGGDNRSDAQIRETEALIEELAPAGPCKGEATGRAQEIIERYEKRGRA